MTTNVVCTIKVPGMHSWPEAPAHVAYLRFSHRHLFWVTAKKLVTDLDREVEFITLGQQISAYLETFRTAPYDMIDFGASSCEMIAQSLLETFSLSYCSVFEDGENGAEVTR